MKERLERLNLIRKLIHSQNIESQTALLEHVQKAGFDATQATLSRDLKLLKAARLPDNAGGYKYSLPPDTKQNSGELYAKDFMRGCISIDCSGNMAVIKTHSGHSNTVAEALDCLAVDNVLGTMAGDNCIFVCLREGVGGTEFLRKLKEKIPALNI